MIVMKDYQKECPLCGHMMELEPNLCHGYICINCHTVFQEQEFKSDDFRKVESEIDEMYQTNNGKLSQKAEILLKDGE